MKWKVVGIWTLVAVLAILSYLTISNQLETNRINAVIAQQAQAGQSNLTRTCRLVPISKKIYMDMLDRRKITADDYDFVVSSAAQICPAPKP